MLPGPPTGSITRRSPLGVAAVAALALCLGLGLAACASSGDHSATVVATAGKSTVAASVAPTATATATTKPAARTVAPTTAAGAAPSTAPQMGPAAPDAAGMLAKAVEALRPGYDVDSNVTTGDRATNVAGRVVGTNSQFTLTNGGAVVEYLRVPPQTWVRDPGGDWTESSAEAAPREALTPLASPKALEFVSAGGDGQHLKATYDGASLGSETPTVDATMVVEPNGGLTVTYAATTQGKVLSVTTRLAPAADTTPIAAPA